MVVAFSFRMKRRCCSTRLPRLGDVILAALVNSFPADACFKTGLCITGFVYYLLHPAGVSQPIRTQKGRHILVPPNGNHSRLWTKPFFTTNSVKPSSGRFPVIFVRARRSACL